MTGAEADTMVRHSSLTARPQRKMGCRLEQKEKVQKDHREERTLL